MPDSPGNGGRLTALYETGLLDSPPEPAYDRLTQLATRLLGVPVSQVSLVETDRQFFKSAVGMPEPWASLRQTPLSHSFCKHVVTSNAMVIVEDASSDPLAQGNLAVTDFGVAAYLGVPLMTPEGYVLGSLCAIDSKPRQWTSANIADLTGLASIAMTEIALRLQVAKREEAERQQRLLARELNHRVKNTLAMVRSLVNLSLQTADNLASFQDSIGKRIESLSNAHALLVDRKWGPVFLKELIEGELKPVSQAGRVAATGPDLAIPATDAIYISMGLHELLTNAIKHGALSASAGQVYVDWSVTPEENGNRLALRWIESGGPPVTKPKRNGFGTLLLEQILGQHMNGQVVTEYAAEGLRATIDLLV
jgi:two-component sensor histidine kinase